MNTSRTPPPENPPVSAYFQRRSLRIDRGGNNVVFAKRAQELYNKQLSRVNYYYDRVKEYRIEAEASRSYYGPGTPEFEAKNAEKTAGWEKLLKTYEEYLKTAERRLEEFKEDLKFYQEKDAEFRDRTDTDEDKSTVMFIGNYDETVKMLRRSN